MGYTLQTILVPSTKNRDQESAPRIATSGRVQQRKSAIHGLPVTLRMLRVKSDKSDWFWSQSIVFINPFQEGGVNLLAQLWDCAADDLSHYDVTRDL